MTIPITNIDNTTLLNLTPNLDIGDIADPALRLVYFQYLNVYIQSITTAFNAFVANGGVVTANIGDLAVTTAKLALGAVTAAQMATGAVGNGQLADGAVTSVKIADDTIVNADINSAAAISWSKISKTLSSLADLANRSAADLNSGTLNVARLPTAIPVTSIGNGDVTNAILSFLSTLTSNAQAQLDAKVPLSQKGVANGVATLDSAVKIPIAQLPDAILGALIYQGTYNATTNTPALPSAVGNKGWFYIVSAAGTVSGTIYDIGDWIVSNGTVWQKVDNTDAVASFNGRLGAIVPATGDYTWAQITKTISSLADLTNRSASDLNSGTLPTAQLPAFINDVTSAAGSASLTIANLAVNTAKLAALAVTTAKIADGNVTTLKIADSNVTTSKIADANVTTSKLVDGSVTAAKLDPSILVAGIPLATHIAANPIDHPDGSITPAKLSFDPATQAELNTHAAFVATNTEYGHLRLVDIPSGKKLARIVVGISTAGWTAADCDYLCNGSSDEVEINAAIAALPATGGEIVILSGLYNLTAKISINKNKVKLRGSGSSTILKRVYSGTGVDGLISIESGFNNCTVSDFYIDGNKGSYGTSPYGISVISNNNIISGNYIYACGTAGIGASGNGNVIVGNNCPTNGNGIEITGTDNTVAGNLCNSGQNYGISLSGSGHTVTGNTCNYNNRGILASIASKSTIAGNTCNGNTSIGISIQSTTLYMSVTGNTCFDNGTGIFLGGDVNTIVGNSCARGTGTAGDYTAAQYTIQIPSGGDNNLVTSNNCLGKDVANAGLTNTLADNKF